MRTTVSARALCVPADAERRAKRRVKRRKNKNERGEKSVALKVEEWIERLTKKISLSGITRTNRTLCGKS
jgi:hypothetical protein